MNRPKRQYLCPHCHGNFNSGPGLVSHRKAREKQGGICGDTRGHNHVLKSGTMQCPHCHWHCTSPAGLASHERARVANSGVCREVKHKSANARSHAPTPTSQLYSRFRRDSIIVPSLEEMAPPGPDTRGKERVRQQPLPLFVPVPISGPSIRDVPPGEEGWWKVDANGKRLLSAISGIPMLDPTSRDYLLHEALHYFPHKIGPDGKLK